LPKSGNVGIKIFDINGKCLKTLFNGKQAEGAQNISWDSRNDDNKIVSSGVYLYQIIFDNEIISKKMLLIK
jgi:flagellar hook assembly protein FlgD